MKQILTSDIAKIFDVLGWIHIAPITIKAKILLQRLWEEGLHWDEYMYLKTYETIGCNGDQDYLISSTNSYHVVIS